MKKFLLALACGISFYAPAQAALVTYQYTGVVSLAFTNNLNDPIWGTAFLDGYTVVPGNTIKGTLTYDTANALWIAFRPGHDFYKGTGASSLNVLENGFSFQSTTDDIPQMQVGNGSPLYGGTTDHFAFGSHTHAIGANPQYTFGLSLFDRTGTVFQNTALPSQLDLSGFHQKTVEFYHYGVDTVSSFTAELTSLELINDVPEPASPALVFAGLGVLLGLRRFKSGKKT